jgi:hypothetical protein
VTAAARALAKRRGVTMSEITSRALLALLEREEARAVAA